MVIPTQEQSLSGSLEKKIRDGPLDVDKICHYVHALYSALRQLHGCGLVVRDIKPPNILFDSFDRTVLADFGIPEVVTTAVRCEPTCIKVTFNYMAPETFLFETGLAFRFSVSFLSYRLIVGLNIKL